MQFKHGAYYCLRQNKWHPLGKEYGAALVKYAELVGSVPQVRTVKDAVWGYIEFAKSRKVKPLAAATLAGYLASAANVCAVFGKLALSDLTQPMVYRYVTEKGNVQANRDKALLSAAFSHARNLGALTGEDPTKGLQFRIHEQPRQRYVEDAEETALQGAASPKLAVIMRFLYLTGMRQSDALRVRLSDLDDAGFTYWNTKGKKWQGLEWSDELKATVDEAKRLWRRFGREYLFESVPKGKHAKRGAGAYTPSGLRALFRVARKKSGVKDVTLHDLRRKAGSDVEEGHAQQLLGHSDPKVTRRHYRAKVSRSKPVK
jgi:integrase